MSAARVAAGSLDPARPGSSSSAAAGGARACTGKRGRGGGRSPPPPAAAQAVPCSLAPPAHTQHAAAPPAAPPAAPTGRPPSLLGKWWRSRSAGRAGGSAKPSMYCSARRAPRGGVSAARQASRGEQERGARCKHAGSPPPGPPPRSPAPHPPRCLMQLHCQAAAEQQAAAGRPWLGLGTALRAQPPLSRRVTLHARPVASVPSTPPLVITSLAKGQLSSEPHG